MSRDSPCDMSLRADSLQILKKVPGKRHGGSDPAAAVRLRPMPEPTREDVDALVDRTLVSLDGQHKVRASGGAFTTSFTPLEARIYIAAPAT